MNYALPILPALLMPAGCGGKGGTDMTAEQKAVLASFERFQQAMIDKDVETLNSLVTSDKTFTHMSGKKQTREEFFGEIRNGVLNYYRYQIHSPIVTVNGDTATLTASTTLTAMVYGISGSWTLSTDAHLRCGPRTLTTGTQPSTLP